MTVESANMAATGDGSESTVRKRRLGGGKTETKCAGSSGEDGAKPSEEPETERSLPPVHAGTHWLTRVVLLRSVAFIYREHVDSDCKAK